MGDLKVGSGSGLFKGIGFDPESVLVREPRILLETQFLGALHAELEDKLGDEEASVTLLQIGFLHGLRDAARVAEEAMSARRPKTRVPTPAPLPILLRANGGAQPAGAIELHGCWPERHEASARLARIGPSEGSACFLSAGYTSGWLSGVFEADILAVETTCCACGSGSCRFVAREAAAWRDEPSSPADALLDALPFDAFRKMIRDGALGEPAEEPDTLESGTADVHIWGPVMVIPFAGADEALSALELIGCDPEAGGVTVIVLDLTGAVIDEAFGAVALERIVEVCEVWGAEVIFAGVSTQSQAVIDGLARPPLLVHKDLEGAIAAGFQIAEAQRRMV